MNKREAKIEALGIVVAEIEAYLVSELDDRLSEDDEARVRDEIERIQDELEARRNRLLGFRVRIQCLRAWEVRKDEN